MLRSRQVRSSCTSGPSSCYLCHDVAETVASCATSTAQGVEVIAVHQPRSPEELDVAKVTEDALGPMRITQPCAIDNQHAIVDRFGNQFVPAFYLFNHNHELRHFQAGDKGTSGRRRDRARPERTGRRAGGVKTFVLRNCAHGGVALIGGEAGPCARVVEHEREVRQERAAEVAVAGPRRRAGGGDRLTEHFEGRDPHAWDNATI